MIYQYLSIWVRRIGVLLVAVCACETAEAQLPASAPSLNLPWVVGGHPVREFAVTDTADGGRTVTLRRTTYREAAPGTFGSTTTRIPAAPFAGRRIRIAAELRTHYARNGASLWVRLDDKNNRMLALDNGKERKLTSDHDWVPWTTELYVVPESDHVTFGLLLWGEGIVRMRNLVLTPIELPPADAPTLAGARALVDTASVIARSYTLRRDTISWNTLIPELHQLVAGAQTIDGAYPAIQRLVRRLGDHHSEFYPPSSRIAAVLRSDTTVAEDSTQEEDVESRWVARARAGYLTVPGHGGASVKRSRLYVAYAQSQLMALRDSGACGWVVDLRNNRGGNMWPMLAGLRPLLGEGTLGAFVTRDTVQRWGARAPWDATDEYVKGLPPWANLADQPIAVLTGTRTASSGESVAIAFRGRPNTRSFGGPTAGFTTGNGAYALPGGAVLNIATVFEADRTGARYSERVRPDEVILDDEGPDTVLERALSWLTSQPDCSTS